MSIFNHYTLSPGAVASMTQPTPDLQRNYRQRNMLAHYGELQENGRWKYSLSDLVAIWICDCLSQNGQIMERRDGFKLGHMLAGRVIANFIKQRKGFTDGARYEAIIHSIGVGDGTLSGSEIRTIASLDDLDQNSWEYAQIIDIWALVLKIPPQIQGLLIAADENEFDAATPDFDEMLKDAPAVGNDS